MCQNVPFSVKRNDFRRKRLLVTETIIVVGHFKKKISFPSSAYHNPYSLHPFAPLRTPSRHLLPPLAPPGAPWRPLLSISVTSSPSPNLIRVLGVSEHIQSTSPAMTKWGVGRAVFHGFFRGSSKIPLGPAMPYYSMPCEANPWGLATHRTYSIFQSLNSLWIPHGIRPWASVESRWSLIQKQFAWSGDLLRNMSWTI
jgi:hypothetical protein